ncbi:MAG: hypothetical protein ACREX8_05870 [Gammaproteobacteria bacterium]
MTYMYSTMERCNDSYGVLGRLGQEALITYATLPPRKAGIVAEDWCEDLCELVTSERYGLLLGHETAVFANIHGALADHAERFLVALANDLRTHRLAYEAGEAQQSVAHLQIAHGRVTCFIATAAALGSDHWRPIVAMAEAALTRGRTDIARATFAAADRPETRQDYLCRRCIELTGAAPTAAQ